ncbi:MAG: acyl-CoA thioesterase [Verrucomicrobiae bacterium]|nr:acyl-CoA thioesterase [Verrucomicrobiae bacterium]
MFRHEIRVPYSAITLGNHVYYARYFDWLEAARGEAFRELGTPFAELQESDAIFPVLECEIRYFKPARYDDVVEIRSWFSKLSAIRFEWEYEIARGGDVLAKARTSHVCATMQEKPRKIPPELARAMEPHLRAELATS